MEFYNRKTELKDLMERYKELDSGEMCIIYGRRRVGKTEFIKRFLDKINRDKAYYFVNKTNKKELLNILANDIYDQTGESENFLEWEDFLEYLNRKSSKKKFVMVIDEFSRIKEQSPEFLTKFQNYWDSKLSKNKILFVAIGSSMSMMYNIFMEKTSPLYGRMTLKMAFKPFRYVDFREMFAEVEEKQKIKIYSIFGGTPHFLWFVKKHAEKDIISLIEKMVLKKTAPLREEPNNFITMELSKETNYNSVLHAIAKTNGTRQEIVHESGVHPKDVNYYLSNLIELLHIIGTKKPLFYARSSKPRYKFKDNFFCFWYRYIFPNRSLIELGNTNLLKKRIKKDIEKFIGQQFEEVIKELLILYNGKKIKDLNVSFDSIGPWWGKNKESGAEEIDIVANDPTSRKIIVCEVKWTKKIADLKAIENLVRKSRLINASGTIKYLFVSKSGFTKESKEYMKEKKITYLDLKDIAELFEKAK